MTETKHKDNSLIPMAETTPLPPRKKRSWRDPNISLAGFLALALVAAAIIVFTGHMLYVTSSEYKLDITRPGLKDIKKDELVEVDRSQTYDSTSPINRSALDNEQKSMNSRLQDLDRYGDFGDDELEKIQESLLNGSQNPEQ